MARRFKRRARRVRGHTDRHFQKVRVDKDKERELKRHVSRMRITIKRSYLPIYHRTKRIKYGKYELKIGIPYKKFKIEREEERRITRQYRKQEHHPSIHHVFLTVARTLARRRSRLLQKFEQARAVYDLMRGRAVILAKILAFKGRFTIFKKYAMNMAFDEIPLEERDRVMQKLISYSRSKHVPESAWRDIYVRMVLTRFMAMFKEYPCNFNSYAIMITPVTFRYLQNLTMTYYVLRIVRADSVKADPYIGKSRIGSFHTQKWTYKNSTEIINTVHFVGRGILNYALKGMTSSDELGRPMTLRFIRDMVFRPHTICHDIAKSLGLIERWQEFDTSTVYGIVQRKSRRAKLYEHYDGSVRYARAHLALGHRRRFKTVETRSFNK